MTDNERVDRFAADIAAMQVKTSGRPSLERATGIAGLVLMGLSLLIGIGSYFSATSLDNALDQNELIVLGFFCVALAVVGAALWLQTALVRFWRFWMLRLIYENKAEQPD
ncbi:MAG: hypothetical protein ACKPDI_03570 [Actinomycetota bacterium]